MDGQRWKLLERCLPMLHRNARRLARDRDAAADIVQETCLRVLASTTAPDELSLFSIWCCGVARNVAAQHWRRQLRTDRKDDRGAALDDIIADASAEDSLYLVERLAQLKARVDPDSLALFVRHYVFDERICDLAAERAQSAASLRMRLMRVRAVLRGTRE